VNLEEVAMTARPFPPGLPVLSPYLVVKDAPAAIAFYVRAFGAEERYRLAMPDGRIGHAELRIRGAVLMLADPFPEYGIAAPGDARPSVTLHLYVDDVDAVAARAVEAGAQLVRPVKDEFYGDRAGQLRDPSGHVWHLATHLEDVSPEEMQRRIAAGAAG
jgi:PhnB protein